MTDEEIDALDGFELARGVMVNVLGIDNSGLAANFALKAIEDEPAQWDFIRHIQAAMEKHGFWMNLNSKWRPAEKADDTWWAGFTPHGVTGWNGYPDNRSPGLSAWVAVARAALKHLEVTP